MHSVENLTEKDSPYATALQNYTRSISNNAKEIQYSPDEASLPQLPGLIQ